MKFSTNARALPSTRPRRGYTLLEMLAVVTIIAITTGIALPRVNVAAYRADANANIVRGALQTAQRLAVTRQSDIIVGFDVTSGVVRVLEDRNNNQRTDAGERLVRYAMDNTARFVLPPTSVPVTMGGTGSVVALSTQLVTIDGLPSVVFHRNGAASRNAEIYMVSTQRATNEYRAVLVTQATGRTDAFRSSTSAPTWRKAST